MPLSWFAKLHGMLRGKYYTKCDGVDAGAFFNEAFDFLPKNPGGRAYAGHGTYSFTTKAIINKSNVNLIGSGKNATIFENAATDGSDTIEIYKGDGVGNIVNRVHICDIGFTFNAGATAGDALVMENVQRGSFERLAFYMGTAVGNYLVRLRGVCYFNKFLDFDLVSASTYAALRLEGDNNVNWFERFRINSCTGWGVSLALADAMYPDCNIFHNFELEGNDNHGVVVAGGIHNQFVGFYFESHDTADKFAMKIDEGADYTIVEDMKATSGTNHIYCDAAYCKIIRPYVMNATGYNIRLGSNSNDNVVVDPSSVPTDEGTNNTVFYHRKGLKVKDSPTRPLSLDSQSDTGWTDLDLTAHTSADATAVLLYLYIMDSGGANAYLAVRKNGETPAQYPIIRSQVANVYNNAMALVACDSGQVIEYMIEATGANTASVRIDVLGYFEG